MLYAKIKADQLAARKSKETLKISLLTTLLGEAGTSGKEAAPSDESVIAKILSFKKKIKETIDERVKRGVDISEQEAELAILNEYLPKQLSDAELKDLIESFISEKGLNSVKQMSMVMGYLSGQFKGQFDGNLAKEMVLAALSD
ncbi:GatB/YqeY domain-containing protein [Neptuniibacter sp. QD37_11]|uniref:GatB/YqeY domain-containing protein n=1 Tax=Neptuniibacter sp. QD37_11 TaxID=3398209 RepID=UPI0039F59BFA